MSEPTTGAQLPGNAYEYTCAISGEKSPGKHYVLNTTEGQETIAPESLFHNAADRKMGQLVLDIARRLELIEHHLFSKPEPAAAQPDTQDQEQQEPAAVEEAQTAPDAPEGEQDARS